MGWTRSAPASCWGSACEYDLGNMYDPAYTMVCKLAKQALAELTP